MSDHFSLEEAARHDRNDELAGYRKNFRISEQDVIYLDGNSLGRLPERSAEIIGNAVDYQWGERLIRSWNEDWYTKNQVIGDKIAIVAGASPGEIVVTDTTSVNLYKLAYSALRFKAGRKKIITDNLNFPSDIYILQGLVNEFGGDYFLEIVESRDGISIHTEDIARALDDNTALVSLSHVAFKSAFRYPMKEITTLVQEKGGLMLWDLSHSIGAVPGELNISNAAMAVGCTYKYLNGGPGSPAFLYIRKDLQNKLLSPIWGWFGEKSPFDFDLNYRPAEGIRRFLAGTPPIVSLSAIEPTLDLMIEAGMDTIRMKSVAQSEYLSGLAEHFLYPMGFKPGSPEGSGDRGSHLTLRHPEAYRICKALIDPNIGDKVIIPDFRDPDNIRIGITPLYTTFEELFIAVMQLEGIVREEIYKKYSIDREQVT